MTAADHIVNAFFSFSGFSLYRAVIGTPLDGIAKREILSFIPTTTWKVIRSVNPLDLWKGFQPTSLRLFTRTYAQVISFNVSSRIAPKQLDPALRGALIGLGSSFIEVGVNNAFNSLATRFVQGQGWNVLKQEGPGLLTKGFSSALLHRNLSGIIFWSVYEKLNHITSYHPAYSAVGAGVIQVSLTSPLYITMILRQGKASTSESLWYLFKRIRREKGGLKGLFFPGLVPRLVHSLATSSFFMMLLEENRIILR